MLSLFIAFGFSACSLSNDDANVDCGLNKDLAFRGFPLLCNYSIKDQPNNPASLLANSEERMNYFFNKHENSCPVASDPKIDFTKDMLIGIFAGIKSTSGYSIKMTSIVENDCEIIINYYESGPQAGESITQTPTYPSDFILIPKSTKTILFNRTNENPDNIVVGTYNSQCTSNCQKFYQINDYNSLQFLDVKVGQYDFSQYKYNATTKRGDYTLLLKSVPTEILNLKGQTKTYGSPDTADQGGIFFQLKQGSYTTRIFIDPNDTADQSAEIKAFKKLIKDRNYSEN